MKVKRFDIREIKDAERTAQGYVRAPAFATRIGVFKYRKADGSLLRELRLPDEVFKKESMQTLAGVPVTMDHPREMLDSANTKPFTVGWTHDTVEREDKFLKTLVTVFDQGAIEALERGKTQVSCGYTCELEEKPGVFDGEEFDVIQRNIEYNHLAIVDRGRAGPSVKIHLDAADAVLDEFETGKKGEIKMEKIMLGGKEFEVAPELAAALKAHMAEMEAAKGEMDGKMKEMEAMKAEKEKAMADMCEQKKAMDSLQAKFDTAQAELEKAKEVKTDEAAITEKVKARVELVRTAEKHCQGEQPKFDDMTDRQVKEAVVKSYHPTVVFDGKSDEYVNARFDSVLEVLSASEKKLAKIGGAKTPDGGEVSSADEARKKMIQNSMDGWKQPLSSVKAEK